MIKEGSRWTTSDSKQFIVLARVELEDGVWIHYREDSDRADPREYSCYEGSFLARFRPHVN